MRQCLIIILAAIISLMICGCTGTNESDIPGGCQRDTIQKAIPVGNPFYESYCTADSVIGKECDDALSFLKEKGWMLKSCEKLNGEIFSYKLGANTSCDIEMEIRPGETGKVYGVFVIYENWDENSDFERRDIYLDFIRYLHTCCNYRECQVSYGTQDNFDYLQEEYINDYDILLENFADVYKHISWSTVWNNAEKQVSFSRFNGGDDGFGYPALVGTYADVSIRNDDYR